MIMATDNKNKVLNVPNLRFPEFKEVWKDSNIGKCFDLYSGNTPSRMEKEHFIGDVNWITSGELKEHYIGDTKERISENSFQAQAPFCKYPPYRKAPEMYRTKFPPAR